MQLKFFKNGNYESKAASVLIFLLSVLIFSSTFAISPAFAVHDNIILLTTSEDWHYAVMASGLSARYYYPLYLTPSNALSEEVKEELKGPVSKRVIIIGGEDVISSSIETELNNLRELYSWQGYWGLQVERVEGKDVYETSALLVDKWPEVNGIIVTRGDIFPDALVASQLSAIQKSPLLFTKSEEVPSSTLNKIKEIRSNATRLDVTIVGGPVAVSEGVENFIKMAGGDITRIGGKDRYETSTMIAERFIEEMNGAEEFVSSVAFVDGVNGDWASTLGAQCYLSNSLILYLGSLPDSVKDFLKVHREINNAVIFSLDSSSKDYSSVTSYLEEGEINLSSIQKTNPLELSFTMVNEARVKEKEELSSFSGGDQEGGVAQSGGGGGGGGCPICGG